MDDNASQATPQPQMLPFEFSGKGSEYFSIWIVNVALTIVTFGIYSAWAKVRKLQYLYRNTSLAGSSFDYHGNPLGILKGRMIALGALVAVQAGLQFAPGLGFVLILALAAVMPWMIKRSLQFKLYNSSYRGLRFGFTGATSGAYRVFLGLTLAAGLTLGLLWPYAHQQIKQYQHSNSRFGQTSFGFTAPAGAFYQTYFIAGLLGIVFLVLLGILAASTIVSIFTGGGANYSPVTIILITLLMLGFLGLYQALIGPFIQARLQNVIWNNTNLGPHQFLSTVSARKMIFITFTNLLLIVLTLGLYKPFATIRLLRYQLASMSFVPQGSLDNFVANQLQQQSATGEETAEMFDIDISL